MRMHTGLGSLMLAVLGGCASTSAVVPGVRPNVPVAVLRTAAPFALPGAAVPEKNLAGLVDCNNPVHWDGEAMYVFSSIGYPDRSSGPDLFNLARPSVRTRFDNEADQTIGGRWIEAAHKDDGGLLYGWYHNEPLGVCGPDKR